MRKKLQILRIQHSLTQDQMAVRLGVTRTTYNKVETGKSNGTTNFWLAVKREFPEVNIEDVAKIEERKRP